MNLVGTPLLALLSGVKNKQYTHAELHTYFADRIRAYDKNLNSYLSTQKEASGFPLAIKDNFCTKGMVTTASSYVLEDFVPPYDATVISRLKQAEFGVLGKTNMDAWAHGSSTETSDFGPTKNPSDPTRVAGGSSGGSAAAVAAYLAPAAIGSETAGSIRQPSAWCGVVGLKPTYGRVSRYGVVAMGSSWDCPGPITTTVADAAYLLGVLAGQDPYDATSSPTQPEDYLGKIESSRKLTIGICESYFEGLDAAFVKPIYGAIEEFKRMGHTVVPVSVLSPKYAISVYTILQRAEVSSNLARYDGIRFGRDRTHFKAEAKRRMMLGAYTLSHGYYDQYYKKAEKVRMLLIEDFERAFQACDVIVAPTTPCVATKIGDMDKYPFFGELMDQMNEPAAAAGIPAINIPVGTHDGMPVGMQIMGRRFDELGLLQLAHAFEKETEFFNVTKTVMNSYKEV